MDDVSLGRRIGALMIDWLISGLTAVTLFRASFPPDGIKEGLITSAIFVVEVGVLVGLLGFSIGKRIVRIRVINKDGNAPGLLRALLRTLLLSFVLPAIIMTEDKRGLHDLAAGTKVVQA